MPLIQNKFIKSFHPFTNKQISPILLISKDFANPNPNKIFTINHYQPNKFSSIDITSFGCFSSSQAQISASCNLANKRLLSLTREVVFGLSELLKNFFQSGSYNIIKGLSHL